MLWSHDQIIFWSSHYKDAQIFWYSLHKNTPSGLLFYKIIKMYFLRHRTPWSSFPISSNFLRLFWMLFIFFKFWLEIRRGYVEVSLALFSLALNPFRSKVFGVWMIDLKKVDPSKTDLRTSDLPKHKWHLIFRSASDDRPLEAQLPIRLIFNRRSTCRSYIEDRLVKAL